MACLPTPGEQQALRHSMSARDAAHSLASLQRLFNQTNLLVVTPSAPTFSAQDLDLHSPHNLKARLKVTSSNQPQNLARRSSPEGDVEGERQLAEREALLIDLKKQDMDLSQAELALEMMRETQRQHENDRQRLLSLLQP